MMTLQEKVQFCLNTLQENLPENRDEINELLDLLGEGEIDEIDTDWVNLLTEKLQEGMEEDQEEQE